MSTLNKFSRRLNNLLSLSNDLLVGTRLAVKLPFFLRNPITLEEAKAVVKDRLERREKSFLAIARKGIYQSPESPYLKLLKLAGCKYGDLEKLVNKDGIEGALRALFLNGVYLTVEEFKGRRPAIRGNQTIEVDPGSLRSPLSALHVLARTSGSRGPRTMVAFDLKFIWDCAVNTCLALEAQGGRHWAKADWEGPGGRWCRFQTSKVLLSWLASSSLVLERRSCSTRSLSTLEHKTNAIGGPNSWSSNSSALICSTRRTSFYCPLDGGSASCW